MKHPSAWLAVWSLPLLVSSLWAGDEPISGLEETVEPTKSHFYIFSPTRHRSMSYTDLHGEQTALRFYSSSLSGPYPFDASGDLVFMQNSREGDPTEVVRIPPSSRPETSPLLVVLPPVLSRGAPHWTVFALGREALASGEVILLNLTDQAVEAIHRSGTFPLHPFIPSEPQPIGRRGGSFRIEDRARQQTRIFVEAVPGQRLLVTLSPPFSPGTRELQVHTLSLPDPDQGIP